MQLSNTPAAGLTTFESWDGTAWTAVGSTSYHLDGAYVYLERGTSAWTPLSMPTRYRVTYTAGYVDNGEEDTSAPEDIKQAVLLLVGHWYENREGVVTGVSTAELPFAVSALLDPHVRVAI